MTELWRQGDRTHPERVRSVTDRPRHKVLGSVSVRFLGFLRNFVLRKWEPIGSQKFLEPTISAFSYFGWVPVQTELTELF